MTNWMSEPKKPRPKIAAAKNETTTLATHSTRVPIQKGWRLMRPSKSVKR
jgi:hypothetical protein